MERYKDEGRVEPAIINADSIRYLHVFYCKKGLSHQLSKYVHILNQMILSCEKKGSYFHRFIQKLSCYSAFDPILSSKFICFNVIHSKNNNIPLLQRSKLVKDSRA